MFRIRTDLVIYCEKNIMGGFMCPYHSLVRVRLTTALGNGKRNSCLYALQFRACDLNVKYLPEGHVLEQLLPIEGGV